MPAIVNFNVTGPGLFIEEITTGGDNELDLVEIYSEWKDWASTNLGYPPAFRQVGSDPITAIQNLGTTFFLNTGDGWRIRPAEHDHFLQINGNLFTDPPELNPIAATLGAYTVLVRMFVSNLVDAAVARLDLNQLLQAVYLDVANGVAGTTSDIGTPTNPSNNLTDTLTMAAARTLNTIILRGNLTVDQNVSGFNFLGENGHDETTVAMAGYDFDLCNFKECILTGTMTGSVQADSCKIGITTGLAGIFEGCGLVNDFTLAAGSSSVFHHCFSEIPGDARVTVIMGGDNTLLNVRGFSGGLELASMSTGCKVSFDGDPGKLVAGASNVAGDLLYRGSTTVDLTGIGVGVNTTDDRVLAKDTVIDTDLDLQEAMKYMLAMTAGTFAESVVSGTIKDFTFKDRAGVDLFTLRIEDAVGRTRTLG